MSIGKNWRQQLKEKGVDIDEQSHNTIVGGASSFSDILIEIKEKSLAEGIATCVSRNSNQVAFGLPAAAIASQELVDFVEWAEGEDLEVSFDLSPPAAGDERVDFDIVLQPS